MEIILNILFLQKSGFSDIQTSHYVQYLTNKSSLQNKSKNPKILDYIQLQI